RRTRVVHTSNGPPERIAPAGRDPSVQLCGLLVLAARNVRNAATPDATAASKPRNNPNPAPTETPNAESDIVIQRSRMITTEAAARLSQTRESRGTSAPKCGAITTPAAPSNSSTGNQAPNPEFHAD